MTMIDDRPAICDPEPGEAEALFKEAKRRERRRLGDLLGVTRESAGMGWPCNGRGPVLRACGNGKAPFLARRNEKGPRPGLLGVPEDPSEGVGRVDCVAELESWLPRCACLPHDLRDIRVVEERLERLARFPLIDDDDLAVTRAEAMVE